MALTEHFQTVEDARVSLRRRGWTPDGMMPTRTRTEAWLGPGGNRATVSTYLSPADGVDVVFVLDPASK